MSLRFSSILIRLLACGLWLGGSGALAQRRKEIELPPAPPPVVSAKFSANPGETIEIPLAIHGRRAEKLEFLVRTPPKAGKLTAITTTGPNSATVTYTAPERGDAREDRFSYAVRSKEGVSAPAFITVVLAAPPTIPPRIVASDVINFPKVTVGERSTATLEISNRGGGLLEGELKLPEPWTVEGTVAYRLGPGATAAFQLSLQPTKAGRFTGDAELGPEPRRMVALSAEVEAPLVISPDRLKLQTRPGGQTRMATLKLENRSARPLRVTLACDPRLLTEQTVKIAPNETAQVPVFAEADFAAAFTEKLTLTAGAWTQEVPVEVAALKPMLKLISEAATPLRARSGEAVEWVALLENLGGQPASAALSINPPFTLDEATVNLPPGGKKPLRVIAEALTAGQYVATLVAAAGEVKEQLSVNVEVEPASPSPAPPPRTTRRISAASQPAPAPTSDRDRPAGREEFPNVVGDFVRDVRPESACLAWPERLGPATDLSLEERKLSLAPDGSLATNWLPLPGVVFHTDTDPLRAEMPRLQPGQIYTVRVRSGAETLFTAQFQTPQKKPWISIGWQGITISLLLLALAGIGWWQWQRRGRSAW